MARVKTDYRHYIKVLDQMIEDTAFAWANETLEGIRNKIYESESVTPKQINAIMNIRRSMR